MSGRGVWGVRGGFLSTRTTDGGHRGPETCQKPVLWTYPSPSRKLAIQWSSPGRGGNPGSWGARTGLAPNCRYFSGLVLSLFWVRGQNLTLKREGSILLHIRRPSTRKGARSGHPSGTMAGLSSLIGRRSYGSNDPIIGLFWHGIEFYRSILVMID